MYSKIDSPLLFSMESRYSACHLLRKVESPRVVYNTESERHFYRKKLFVSFTTWSQNSKYPIRHHRGLKLDPKYLQFQLPIRGDIHIREPTPQCHILWGVKTPCRLLQRVHTTGNCRCCYGVDHEKFNRLPWSLKSPFVNTHLWVDITTQEDEFE